MNQPSEQLLKLSWIPFVVVVLLWLGWLLVGRSCPLQGAGLFGDMFGGINALFSGLAFAGVLVAIFLQRRELECQKEALELTQKEMAKQTQQFQMSNLHQVLIPIINDYRTPDMHAAVKALWELYGAHPETFVVVYENLRTEQAAEIEALPPTQRAPAEAATLHFQRRMVTHFYRVLGGMYELGVIPKTVLYTYWERGDLAIIPKILVPIEVSLGATLGTSGDPHRPSLGKLLRLHDDSPVAVSVQD